MLTKITENKYLVINQVLLSDRFFYTEEFKSLEDKREDMKREEGGRRLKKGEERREMNNRIASVLLPCDSDDSDMKTFCPSPGSTRSFYTRMTNGIRNLKCSSEP